MPKRASKRREEDFLKMVKNYYEDDFISRAELKEWAESRKIKGRGKREHYAYNQVLIDLLSFIKGEGSK